MGMRHGLGAEGRESVDGNEGRARLISAFLKDRGSTSGQGLEEGYSRKYQDDATSLRLWPIAKKFLRRNGDLRGVSMGIVSVICEKRTDTTGFWGGATSRQRLEMVRRSGWERLIR
ncbi:hypothetical protein KM043_017413 [Ampulex compressa]|nr:hypothetical protein KM043_017413 [Ampulex compressa]